MRLRALVAVAIAVAALDGPQGQVPSPSLLVVVNSAAQNPFGQYLAEILRAEGLNDIGLAPLASVTASQLSAARLVVLAESPLTSSQAALFANYVAQGGRLVAMRPDTQLASVLGVSPAGASTTDGYVLIDQSGPGTGLQAITLPFRGTASHYTLLPGATSVAGLYASSTTSTGRPAVVRYNRTATWAFDLARSTAYTRQGDPALAGVDRDGPDAWSGIARVRTNDIFYQRVDLSRLRVPVADVQMRLLTRVITTLLEDVLPLPRLWYFPGATPTLLVTTSDSHTSDVDKYTPLIAAAQSYGARLSVYLARYITLPSSAVNAWRSAGHEVGLHPYLLEQDNATVSQGYQTATSWFAAAIGGSWGATTRHHGLEWPGWTTPVPVMASYGIRMDTSFYAWGPAMFNPSQTQQAHGYLTGSGLPMKFVSIDGEVYNVYQQYSVLLDEQLVTGVLNEGLSTAAALAVSRTLIDDSEAGGYSALATQFHVDAYSVDQKAREWTDGTMAYAQSRQVPMWPTERWLRYVDARAGTRVANAAWAPTSGRLSFDVTVPAGGEAQTLLVPSTFSGASLHQVVIDGGAVATSTLTINGDAHRAFAVAAGATRSVVAQYGSGAAPPTVSIGDAAVSEGNAGSTQSAVTVSLSSPSTSSVSVAWSTGDGTATAGTDYTGTSGVVTFPAGVTTQSIQVPVLGDALDEVDELLSIVLSNPAGATLSDGVGTVTIVDDDPLTSIEIADAVVVEGSAGATTLVFPVTVAPVSGRSVQVSFSVSGGTATAGSDFQTSSGTVSIPAGATSAAIGVTVFSDALLEPDETLTVTLGAPTNVAIVDGTASGTIVNDDVPPTALGETYTVAAGATLTVAAPGILANDGSAAGGLSAAIVVGPTHGTLVLGPAGGFLYTPTSGYVGPDAFSYRATDASGGSAVAVVSLSVVSSDLDLVANLRVVDVTGSTVTLRWAPPPGGAAPIDYVVEAGVAPGQTLVAFRTASSVPVFSTSAPPGVYFVRVRPVTASGPGQASPDVLVSTSSDLPPTAPAHLLAAVNGSSVDFAWQAPYGGGVPTSSVLVVTGSVSAVVPLGPGERASFTGVPAGAYVASVRAVNPAGMSPPSPAVSLNVPSACSGAPQPPKDLLGFVAGGRVQLLWEPPQAGAAASGYVIDVAGHGSIAVTGRSFRATAPAGSYTVAVRAVNSCGSSAPSPSLAITVP